MSSSSMIVGICAPPASRQSHARLLSHLRTWLPVVACASLFAVESTTYFGADHTSVPLRRVVEAFFGHGVDAHWNSLHHLIRKSGHFLGYGVFSLVCFRGFWISLQSLASRLQRRLQAHGLAILVTFLIAGADEIHQSFLPNRFGQFSDVLLDTCGAAVLGLLLFLAMPAVEGWRLRASRPMPLRGSASPL